MAAMRMALLLLSMLAAAASEPAASVEHGWVDQAQTGRVTSYRVSVLAWHYRTHVAWTLAAHLFECLLSPIPDAGRRDMAEFPSRI